MTPCLECGRDNPLSDVAQLCPRCLIARWTLLEPVERTYDADELGIDQEEDD